MNGVVLDSSAVIALLKEEPGGKRIDDVIDGALMSVVNFAEVVGHFAFLGVPAAEIDEMMLPLPYAVVAADTQLARIAGQMRTTTSKAGLSLGDRFCLALAKREGLPALTADRRWKDVAEDVGVVVELIR